MSQLVSLSEIARVLRRSEQQIMDLVGEKRIPHNTTHEGVYLFPLELVLSKISPLEAEAPEGSIVTIPTAFATEALPELDLTKWTTESTGTPPADETGEAKPVTSTKKKGRKRG